MQFPPYTVTSEVAHHITAMLYTISAYRITNITNMISCGSRLYAFVQSRERDIKEMTRIV